ncbi:MAG: hypothetical protein JRL30_20365 [Deltaproteobacteria bacterium]|nr:hypothetical protein [Deltaproteobacteria bacterium]
MAKEDKSKTSKAEVVLMNLINYLDDPTFFQAYHIQPHIATKLQEIIQELMNSEDGKIISGRRSLDGYTLCGCPKHEYAPLFKCVDCIFYNGTATQKVFCTAPDRRHPKEPNYTYDEARIMQEKWMREQSGLIKKENQDVTEKKSETKADQKTVYNSHA